MRGCFPWLFWCASLVLMPCGGTAAVAADGDSPATEGGQRWTVGVVADNRGGTGTHNAILKEFQKANVELILNLGDMVYPAPGGEWEGIVKQFQALYGGKEGSEFLARRVFVTAGGWDEQYMNQAQKLADRGQTEATRPKRSRPGYEPDNAAGQEFYQRYFQYKDRAGRSGESIFEYTPQRDYYVKYRDLHVLSLYITDQWADVSKQYHMRDDPAARRAAIERQCVWLREKLKTIRKDHPHAPLIVMAHKGSWYNGGGPLADMPRALKEYKVDVALCGDGHIYHRSPDPQTLKLMVPGAFSDSSDGYFLIHLTPADGKIELDHRFNGDLKHRHQKVAGEKLP